MTIPVVNLQTLKVCSQSSPISTKLECLIALYFCLLHKKSECTSRSLFRITLSGDGRYISLIRAWEVPKPTNFPQLPRRFQNFITNSLYLIKTGESLTLINAPSLLSANYVLDKSRASSAPANVNLNFYLQKSDRTRKFGFHLKTSI